LVIEEYYDTKQSLTEADVGAIAASSSAIILIIVSIVATMVVMCCFGCLFFYGMHQLGLKKKLERKLKFQSKVDNMDDVVNKDLDLMQASEIDIYGRPDGNAYEPSTEMKLMAAQRTG